jgi:hypothetical protein
VSTLASSLRSSSWAAPARKRFTELAASL